MACPIHHEGLGAPVREGERHERGPRVVQPDRLACSAPLEERRATDTGGAQMTAEPRRPFRSGGHGEDGAVASLLQVTPSAHRPHHAGRERPRARVIGFVFVKRDDAPLKVEIGPSEPDCLAGSKSLSSEEAVEDAPRKGDLGRGEKPRVLLRVKPPLGLAWPEFRQEPFGQRMRTDESERLDSEGENAVHEDRDAPPRAYGKLGP